MDAIDGKTRLGNGRYEVRGVPGEGAQGVTYDAMVGQTDMQRKPDAKAMQLR